MNTEDNNSNLPQNLSHVKPGAIWARVSTHDQRETSIPSQIDRCKTRLEDEGYTVTHILSTDWTSMDLFNCPQFQELRSLIRNNEVKALAILDRDRLEAKGLQRLVFLSECKEAGVKLLICQGPPLLDEPEGQLVELALAIGKERSVLRARQGSKDGLHDRALKRRLPTSKHKLYGYRWEGERRLVPDHNWPNVKLIFNMLLDGSTYWPIIGELRKRGILSPQGYPEWNKAAISNMVHNPSYTGRYYALKKQAVTPVKRNGATYGNSSQKKLPLDEAHYIPEIEIANPPITWEQRGQILDQLAQHQKLAQRNARRDYLLRGLISCETHTGKRGEPRKYHGQPYHHSWRYVCPVGGCYRPYINGPELEAWILGIVKMLFKYKPDEFYEQIGKGQNVDETKKSIHRELDALHKKYQQNMSAEASLEDRMSRGRVLPEIYEQLKDKYQAERDWIKTKRETLLDQLKQIGREQEAIKTLQALRLEFANRLDSLTTAEWRRLLTTLNLEIQVGKPIESMVDAYDLIDAATILEEKEWHLFWNDGSIKFCFGIPLDKADIRNIVLNNPEPG